MKLWELPRGWHWATMGEVAKVVGGSTPKTSEPSYWGGDIAWITPDDLSGFRAAYIAGGRRSLTQAGYDSCATRMVPAGTVLFTSRAPIGYRAIAAGPVCTNQGFKSFVCGSAVKAEYVYWYLGAAIELVRSMASGTTFPELSGKAAERIPIPVPPLEMQDRIVDAIEQQVTRIDAARTALSNATSRQASFRSAVLRTELQLASGQEGWRSVRLSEIAKIQSGQTPKSIREVLKPAGDLPWIQVSDMNLEGNEIEIQSARSWLASRDAAALGMKIFPPGTIVFPKRGGAISTNKKRVLSMPSSCDLNVMAITPSDGWTRFLWFWFQALDLRSIDNGSNVPQINHGDVAPLEVLLPEAADLESIEDRLESQLEAAALLSSGIERNQLRTAALQRSVLAAAFRGLLVRDTAGSTA